jgi:hypothetical protein
VYISTKYRWGTVVLLCGLAAYMAVAHWGLLPEYIVHLLAVVGKVLVGGALGYIVDRWLCVNDVSLLEGPARERAMLRRTLAIIGGALAVAVGA